MVSVLHLGHNMFSVIHSGLKRAAVTNTSVQRPAQPPLHVPAQQPKANEPHRASEQVMGWFPMAMVGEAHPARREKASRNRWRPGWPHHGPARDTAGR